MSVTCTQPELVCTLPDSPLFVHVGNLVTKSVGQNQYSIRHHFIQLIINWNHYSSHPLNDFQDSTGRPDEDVAAETLISHMKSNNSFIQNLFQGQFRSAITCPSCNNRSCTFDPYVCVSLPLPQRESRPIYVTMVYRSSTRKSMVYGVNVSINALVRDLRNSLAEMCGIHRWIIHVHVHVHVDVHTTF